MKGVLYFLFSLLFSSYKGTLIHELDVALPASDLWDVYGSLRLAELAVSLISDGTMVAVEEGDGGVGTILYVTLPPGLPGPGYRREEFIKIDDKQRLKEVATIEGGMLEYGFTSYLNRFEIIEKGDNSCTVKSTIEYEIDEEHADNVSYVTIAPLASLAEAVSKYLLEKKSKAMHYDVDQIFDLDNNDAITCRS